MIDAEFEIALARTGRTEAEINEALNGVSIDGVTGSISFDENGDAKKDMAFIKTIENSAFKFLTTTTVK